MNKILKYLKECFIAPHGRCPHGLPLSRWSTISHECKQCWDHVDAVDRRNEEIKRNKRIEEIKEAIIRANKEIKEKI